MSRGLRFLLFFLLLSALLAGADLTSLSPQGYVSDFAKVLDPGTRGELERYCARVEQATGAQLAVVTTDTLDGQPIEEVANALYRKWGIGNKQGPNKNFGALLLLAVRDRRSRLELGYGLEPYLSDASSGDILREMRPSLRAGQYGDALQAAIHALGSRIAQARGVQIPEGARPNRPSTPPSADPGIPWLGIFFFLLVLFLLSRANRGRGRRGGGGGFWPGVVWGSTFGSSSGFGGGRSSGGFGGYDSGDSGFSGFGGGSSGGGGASSDW